MQTTPIIQKDDYQTLRRLMGVYDEISFNAFNEFVGRLHFSHPILGDFIVSCFDREFHFQILRPNIEKPLFSDYGSVLGITKDEYTTDQLKDAVINWVINALQPPAPTKTERP